MPNAPSPPRPPKWVTVRDAAELLSISPQGFRQSFLRQLDGDAVREGKPIQVRFDAVLEILVERRAESIRQPGTDPLLTEGDSPGLERYRLAKAKHAELDLEARKGELIDRQKNRDFLGRWASILRRAGDRMRLSSPAAHRTLTEALDECAQILKELDE